MNLWFRFLKICSLGPLLRPCATEYSASEGVDERDEGFAAGAHHPPAALGIHRVGGRVQARLRGDHQHGEERGGLEDEHQEDWENSGGGNEDCEVDVEDNKGEEEGDRGAVPGYQGPEGRHWEKEQEEEIGQKQEQEALWWLKTNKGCERGGRKILCTYQNGCPGRWIHSSL